MIASSRLTGEVWLAEWEGEDEDIFLVLGSYENAPTELVLFDLNRGRLDSIPSDVLTSGRYGWWRRIA